jgi:hypothetical protein
MRDRKGGAEAARAWMHWWVMRSRHADEWKRARMVDARWIDLGEKRMNNRITIALTRWRLSFARLARRRVLLAGIVAAMLLLALAANAFASIPDQQQVYHACMLTSRLPLVGGSLRLIDTERGQQCARYETSVSWSATGATGPAGATGPSGPSGPTGPAGSGLGAYAYIYDDVPVAASLVVGPNSAIPLATNGPISNISHDADSSHVIIQIDGDYHISWSVNVSAAEEPAITVGLVVNNVVQNSTLVPANQQNGQTTGEAILSLNAGDDLELSIGSAFQQFLDSHVSASLTIMKLDAAAP